MKKTTEQIISQINDRGNGFAKVYKQFTALVKNQARWKQCLGAVKDRELLKNIVFCNDTMGTPPVKVFLTALLKADKASITELTPQQRKEIGAFWGYVFKEVFGYKAVKNVSVGKIQGVSLGIRTAACFLEGPAGGVEIV